MPNNPTEDKQIDQLTKALVNYGHQVIYEQHKPKKEKTYVYATGCGDKFVINRIEARALIKQMLVEARLKELDLLEQATNAGAKNMNAYKLHRLKALTTQYDALQNSNRGENDE